MNGNDAVCHIFLEVMELDVDVLGPGLHLWQLHQFERAGVVLEHCTVYFALLGQNGKLAKAHFVHQVH